jgi:hypothetical protein
MSLLFGAQFTKSRAIDEIATCSSFHIINHDRYFGFVAVTAENPVSHKCVVTKGSKTFIALSDEL